MKKLGIPCRIFAFSSKENMDFKDNQKVADMIRGLENWINFRGGNHFNFA